MITVSENHDKALKKRWCPEGSEQGAVQGRREVGNDFQFPLINGECISFSSLKINYSYGGSHKGISRAGVFASPNLGNPSKLTPFVP